MPKSTSAILPETITGESAVSPASPARSGTGGILHLPDALRRYPAKGIVLYNRVSSWAQAGRKKKTLIAKTDSAAREIIRLAPGRLRRIVSAVEKGQLLQPRRRLVEAFEDARKRGAMVVAVDLSRFLRAESYDRRKNRDAWPTDDEYCKLHEMAGGVPLATVEVPDLTEDERHSRATRRTDKAGRPPSIDDALAPTIFKELGCLFLNASCEWRWEHPIREVAKAFDVSAASIQRTSLRASPDGRTWRDAAIDKAVEKGLVAPCEDGYVSLLPCRTPKRRQRWDGRRGRPPKWMR